MESRQSVIMKIWQKGLLVSGLCISTRLLAQENQNFDAPPTMPSDVDASAQAASLGAFEEEREQLLKTLKTEIEPHLLATDVDRLNKNIMRLGSYRTDWAEKGEEFLVANATLAEPYLYRYAILKNARLNRMILRTLLQFSSYRFPRAPMAFAQALVIDDESRILFVKLLGRIVSLQPQLSDPVLQFLSAHMDLEADERLYVAFQACKGLGRSDAKTRELVQSWQRESGSVWARVFDDEVKACIGGG